MAVDRQAIVKLKPPEGLPFEIVKLGHVVLNCSDVERSARFYTEILGFEISDVYPDEMVPGGMVFMRFIEVHHCVALVCSSKNGLPTVRLNYHEVDIPSHYQQQSCRN